MIWLKMVPLLNEKMVLDFIIRLVNSYFIIFYTSLDWSKDNVLSEDNSIIIIIIFVLVIDNWKDLNVDGLNIKLKSIQWKFSSIRYQDATKIY